MKVSPVSEMSLSVESNAVDFGRQHYTSDYEYG